MSTHNQHNHDYQNEIQSTTVPNAAVVPLGGATMNTGNLVPFIPTTPSSSLQSTRNCTHTQEPMGSERTNDVQETKNAYLDSRAGQPPGNATIEQDPRVSCNPSGQTHDTVPNVVGSPLSGACDTSSNIAPTPSINSHVHEQSSRHNLHVQNPMMLEVSGHISNAHVDQEIQNREHGIAIAPNAAGPPLGGASLSLGNPFPTSTNSKFDLHEHTSRHTSFM